MEALKMRLLILFNIVMVGILILTLFYIQLQNTIIEGDISDLIDIHSANEIILKNLELEAVRLEGLIHTADSRTFYLSPSVYILLLKVGFSCLCVVLVLIWAYYLKYYLFLHFNDPLLVEVIKQAKDICLDMVIQPNIISGFDAFGTFIECECVDAQILLYVTLTGSNIRYYVGDISFILRECGGPDFPIGGGKLEAASFLARVFRDNIS